MTPHKLDELEALLARLDRISECDRTEWSKGYPHECARDAAATIRAQADEIAAIKASEERATPAERWQDISTAPEFVVIDIWVDGLDSEGWRVTGEILSKQEPILIKTDDGGSYWAHENGGWPTHWMPLPAPPAIRNQPTGEGEG
jgi:hypothetical protein